MGLRQSFVSVRLRLLGRVSIHRAVAVPLVSEHAGPSTSSTHAPASIFEWMSIKRTWADIRSA
jgi:hypothetical protein